MHILFNPIIFKHEIFRKLPGSRKCYFKRDLGKSQTNPIKMCVMNHITIICMNSLQIYMNRRTVNAFAGSGSATTHWLFYCQNYKYKFIAIFGTIFTRECKLHHLNDYLVIYVHNNFCFPVSENVISMKYYWNIISFKYLKILIYLSRMERV